MLRTLYSLFIILAFFSTKAHAGQMNAFLQVQCIDALDIIKVDKFYLETNPLEQLNTPLQLAGIIAHREFVVLSDNSTHQYSESFTQTCQLDNTQYDVTVEPYLFNSNPEGECGQASSFSITIRTNETTILDSIRTWDECRVTKKTQRKDSFVEGIILSHTNQSVEIEGYTENYEEDNINTSFTHLFDFIETKAISNENIHK